MGAEPSAELITLVERLRLCTAGQVLSQAATVRRLAGELPMLESLWVDALAKARLLTHFQAREINAGRGATLEVGQHYVLLRPLAALGYAEGFLARHRETGCLVRLFRVTRAHLSADKIAARLKKLRDDARLVAVSQVPQIVAAGDDQGVAWAAYPHTAARTAADWLIENGRLPPDSVLHIAREILVGLVELERHGLVHGDLSPAALLLSTDGSVQLSHAGLRNAARPAEGYAYTDLPPEAYDTLAPERIAAGSPSTSSSELYACGVLWWQLLAGRPAFAGGNSLAKLRAVDAARLSDVTWLAPETPERLVKAIQRCTARDPQVRPASFAELATQLGPPVRHQATRLASLLADNRRQRCDLAHAGRQQQKPRWATRMAAAATVSLLLVGVMLMPAWKKQGDKSRAARQRRAVAATSVAAPTTNRATEPPTSVAPPAGVVAASANNATLGGTSAVLPAAFYSDHKAIAPLVLPAERALRLHKLALERGQTVRGADGSRVLAVIPARGLSISVEDVTFENIDFVGEAAAGQPARRAALMLLDVAQATFRGCTFRSHAAEVPRPAIDWRGPRRQRSRDTGLQGQLRLEQCIFEHVAPAVACGLKQGINLEATNVLLVDSGTLVALSPGACVGETVQIALERTTLRASGPVVAVEYESSAALPAQLNVAASDGVFAPADENTLILFAGDARPELVADSVNWTGQGSLMTTGSVVGWRAPDGQFTTLDDDALDIGGLAQSKVEFAGPTRATAADSQVVGWAGPLQSVDPPGVEAARLPLARRWQR